MGLWRAPQSYNFCNILLRFAFFAPFAVESSAAGGDGGFRVRIDLRNLRTVSGKNYV
ncbi:MAG: hypothetical protein WAW23_00020 [Candidatus Methanoperedens sp.]